MPPNSTPTTHAALLLSSTTSHLKGLLHLPHSHLSPPLPLHKPESQRTHLFCGSKFYSEEVTGKTCS